MSPDRIDPRQYSSRTLTLVGSIGIALLAVSFFLEIRIVVTRPNYGNVTGAVRLGWRIAVGLATLGSFLLAIHNARRADSSTEGPAKRFEIKGANHDIDVHLHGFSHEVDHAVDGSDDGESPSDRRKPASDGQEPSSDPVRETGAEPGQAETDEETKTADDVD